MDYRELGRTGMSVSTVSLGTEHLQGRGIENARAVIAAAVAGGMNYFDLTFAQPDFRDMMGAVMRPYRRDVHLTAHFGAVLEDGQTVISRDPAQCAWYFEDYLTRLGTDHCDVLMLFNCDTQEDYDALTRPGGPADLAMQYKREGRTRAIGFSGHTIATARQVVESGVVDMIMFPVNLASGAVPGKQELLELCRARGVSVVAMKPYGGGRLLAPETSGDLGIWQTGGRASHLERSVTLTPAQCLAFVLDQTAVCAAVPGCKNAAEIEAALSYNQAAAAERDYAEAVKHVRLIEAGDCVYCTHCLPCPADVNIAETNRLLDKGREGLSAELRAAYNALPVKASDCTSCGDCEERCPFDVPVRDRMRWAAQMYE
ncbi:MAG: aldo/keto reductase [Anaerolineae bacterium]